MPYAPEGATGIEEEEEEEESHCEGINRTLYRKKGKKTR
jgi:hypothetical protein